MRSKECAMFPDTAVMWVDDELPRGWHKCGEIITVESGMDVWREASDLGCHILFNPLLDHMIAVPDYYDHLWWEMPARWLQSDEGLNIISNHLILLKEQYESDTRV